MEVYNFQKQFQKVLTYNPLYSARLTNKNFCLVSDNCWGALVYRQLGLDLNTPFSWVLIRPEDYLKLLKNLPYYLAQEPYFITEEGVNYPLGLLGDVKLHFLHYPSAQVARDKWKRRLARFSWDNIFVEMTVYNEEQAREFNQLSYPQKISFADRRFPYRSCFALDNWHRINQKIYINGFGEYVLYESFKYFDVVKWLNKELF